MKLLQSLLTGLMAESHAKHKLYIYLVDVTLAGSTEQNVVMGISMGGLVSRYALADMYRSSLTNPIPTNNSQVRLLITHDSPHQGSNVPAAIQIIGRKLINNPILNGFIRPLGDLERSANAPASIEMLKYSGYLPIIAGVLNNNPVTFTANTFLASTYHPMVHFPTGGVPPPPYKFIATSQGSECGISTVGTGGILIKGYAGVGMAPLFGLWSNQLGIDIDLRAGGVVASQICKVIIIKEFTAFFGLIRWTGAVQIINQPDPFPGLEADSQPGGAVLYQDIPSNQGLGFLDVPSPGFWRFAKIINLTYSPGFCFVSRNSALDLKSSVNYAGSLSGGNYIGSSISNISYADEFITQEDPITGLSTNYEHTTFVGRQINFIFEAMQQRTLIIPNNCAVGCDVLKTLKPEIDELVSFSSYAASETHPFFTYLWSISGAGASIVGANNLPNVTITTATPTASVSYILTLTVSTKCSTRLITRIITCNALSTFLCPNPIGGQIITCASNPRLPTLVPDIGEPKSFIITSTSLGISNFSVPVPTTGRVLAYLPSSPTTNPFAELDSYGQLKFIKAGDYTVYAVNVCSVVSNTTSFTLIFNPNCKVVASIPKTPTFTVSPNPSSGNEITISQEFSKTSETSASTSEEQAQSEAKNEEYTLILYNKLQVKVRETTLNTPSKTISTEGLPNDVYFLHIIEKDGNKVVKQVMILR